MQGTCTPVPMNSILGCSDYHTGIDKRPLAFYLKYLPEDNPNVYDVDGMYSGELNLTGYNYQPFIKYKIKINLNTINFGLLGGQSFVTTSAELVSYRGEYAIAKPATYGLLHIIAKKNPNYNTGMSIMIQLPELGHVGLVVDPPEFGSAVGPTELVEEIKGYTELRIPFVREGGSPVMLKIRGTRSVKGCSGSYTINSTTTCNNLIGNYTYWKFEFYPEDNEDLPPGEYKKQLYLIAKDRDVNWQQKITIDINIKQPGYDLPPDLIPN